MKYANWTYETGYCKKEDLRMVVDYLKKIAIQGDFKECYIVKDGWNIPKNASWVKVAGHEAIKVIGIRRNGNELCVYLNNVIRTN